jgi:hypothetical protein
VLEDVRPLIVKLRRHVEVEESWREFSRLIEADIERVCAELDTRWLVSVCDTYADFGDEIEARNAMFVTLIANLEKTSQTYVRWRLPHRRTLAVPPWFPAPKRFRLWDGMRSFDLAIGDVTNNLFRRLHALMEPTPHIRRIFETVLERMQTGETILGTLNRRHGHVFEPDLAWRDEPKYDRWREAGKLPPVSRQPRG